MCDSDQCPSGAAVSGAGGELTGTISVERLIHYNCDNCQQRWSIGDGPTTAVLCCPRCGEEQRFNLSLEFNNESYFLYLHLLVEIHQLFVQGKADSEEADRIRDLMDAPGEQLSVSERNSVASFSEYLYTVTE